MTPGPRAPSAGQSPRETPLGREELTPPHPLRDGLPPAWASAWGEDEYGPFVVFTVGGVDQRLRWVPPGRFQMGSPEEEWGRWDDEGPRHEVVLSRGLWLGETPVTQALWTAVQGDNPSQFEDPQDPQGPQRPVEQVSWEDCQRFLSRLNAQVPGLGARLPTEAEWERACRAGSTTATWLGDLSEEGAAAVLERIAWYSKNSGGKTHPVGLKEANPWGLHDMLGNVEEWCADWSDPYVEGIATDPSGPLAGSIRVVRGGSWLDVARYLRAAFRRGLDPGYRFVYLGFRLAGGQGSAL